MARFEAKFEELFKKNQEFEEALAKMQKDGQIWPTVNAASAEPSRGRKRGSTSDARITPEDYSRKELQMLAQVKLCGFGANLSL